VKPSPDGREASLLNHNIIGYEHIGERGGHERKGLGFDPKG